MADYSSYPHHIVLDELAEVLCARTEREAAPFFRVLSLYYLGTIASSMRAKVVSKAHGTLPVNNYVIALAPSGFGKGKSTGCLEDEVLCDFRDSFRHYVMPELAKRNIAKLASKYAAIHGTTEEEEELAFWRDYEGKGEYLFAVDGGSEAYIKQTREKLLIGNSGAINLQIDEIGTNLTKPGTIEAMASYLELFDRGRLKPKGKVNSAENRRSRELEGTTPGNMLLFGTPSKLLDGGNIEKLWASLLETGYGRRCLFAWADNSSFVETVGTIDEIYERLTNPQNDQAIDTWRQHFATLADINKIDWTIDADVDADKLLITYKMDCDRRMKDISEYSPVQRAEMENRWSRAIKVAGTLAFIEESLTLTEDHVKSAIRLLEESGEAFQRMMERDPIYVHLARFIAASGTELTRSDLCQLPFFKSATKAEQDNHLSMAASWGWNKHIVIKKRFSNNVDIYTGETLRETSLDALSLSYSTLLAHNYEHGALSFAELPNLTQLENHHWCVHAFADNHRTAEKAIPGFNMLVFDIDEGTPLQLCHELLSDYVHMTYTTKSHTDAENRYRLILPMNYELKLNKDDYKEFYRSVLTWLPFPASPDKSTVDISRKWATHPGSYHQNTNGELFNIIPFVPKTKGNDERVEKMKPLASLDNLERWFASNWAQGDRNNAMLKYALALVDNGLSFEQVQSKVLSFNAMMDDPMDAERLHRTVLVTAAKRIGNHAA